jgi:NADH:ubiquinone oxidoreductase subunit K
VYEVKGFSLVKLYEVKVFAIVLLTLTAPEVAVTLMLLILLVGNACQVSLADVALVITLTLVAAGIALTALALAVPASREVKTRRAAKRNFKEYLTSNE